MASAPFHKAWITPDAMKAILDAYRGASSAEPCGVLLGSADGTAVRIRGAMTLPNTHPMPDRGFLLAPEDLLTASKGAQAERQSIIGFWHGHLRGGPFPGRQDVDEFLRFSMGPNAAWAKVLVLVGRGGTGRPVARAYMIAGRILRELPLRA